MPSLLHQPHREFYALVPLLLLLEPIGGDEALQGLHAHLHGGGGVLAHVLIQTGGMGVVTVAVAVVMCSGRRIGLRRMMRWRR